MESWVGTYTRNTNGGNSINITYETLKNVMFEGIYFRTLCEHIIKNDDEYTNIITPTYKEMEEIHNWFNSVDNYYIGLLEDYETIISDIESNDNGFYTEDYSVLSERKHLVLLELWEDSGYRELDYFIRILNIVDYIYEFKENIIIFKKKLISKNIRLAILNGKTPLGKIYKKQQARKILSKYLVKAMWDTNNKLGIAYFNIRLKRDGLENMFVDS